MEIRSNTEALMAFLGVSAPERAQTSPIRNADSSAAQETFEGDSATFSQAAKEVSHSATRTDVRMEKVLAIQKALAAGTYDVPASEVADKVIDSMLTNGLGA
jgi:flagellar biosynthesis anti-sigma factor FlgM